MDLIIILAVLLLLLAVAGGIWISPILWVVVILAVLAIAVAGRSRWY